MKVNPQGRGLEGIRELAPWKVVAEDTDSGYAYLRTLPDLAHYGEKDPGVNKGIPETEEAMRKYEKSYTYKIYPGAQHGFSDTSERYHPDAAKEAWTRTLEFFKKNLKG